MSLIEGSIEPAPAVWVSGAGGLRPSSLSYKTQLQNAAMSAKAFVGVITNASKDRAWLYFEAGAAWGRRCLYAPLLIDVNPSDLGTTINEYQATKAADEDAVRLLMGDLAEVTGGRVVPRKFGRRYAAFGKAIEKYKSGRTGEPDEPAPMPEWADDVQRAALLRLHGKTAEANELFARLERDPATTVYARLGRIVYDVKRPEAELLAELERVSEEDQRFPQYKYWHGLFEPEPTRAIADLEAYLAQPGDKPAATSAILRIASLKNTIGKSDEAVSSLVAAMANNSRIRRAAAASHYCELWPSSNPMGRLAAIIIGLMAEPSPQLLRFACDLAHTIASVPLGVYFARRYATHIVNGASANSEGIAYDAAGLPSLAYASFQKAAAEGTSVANANMASLLHRGAVPGAGLELFRNHQGTFDAAGPDFPHSTRAAIEQAVQAERTKAMELEEVGMKIFSKLSIVASEGIATTSPLAEIEQRYRMGEVQVLVERTPDGSWLMGDEPAEKSHLVPDARVRVERLFPGNALIGGWNETGLVLVVQRPTQHVAGVSTHLAPDGAWVDWEPLPVAPT